ncbi:hypothetical protein H2199_004125 [Coniosporium tulheliwenetii]|uniref:Uncharacterized protein n=1 Tax=Coniosporium tulheliwenetii TaxID=3383036 RepID=A0ACC2Z6Z1_9PEZI|nr:hypothetical protein H2199_004125 [Cladosporium sp. JES 115]
MSAPRPPITCHVLDTTTGRPGASIPVTLTFLSFSDPSNPGPSHPFTGITNADGRAPERVRRGFEMELDFRGQGLLEAEGVEAFFEEVEVKFTVHEGKAKEHFHVPVLVGPFSYTTYRGS